MNPAEIAYRYLAQGPAVWFVLSVAAVAGATLAVALLFADKPAQASNRKTRSKQMPEDVEDAVCAHCGASFPVPPDIEIAEDDLCWSCQADELERLRKFERTAKDIIAKAAPNTLSPNCSAREVSLVATGEIIRQARLGSYCGLRELAKQLGMLPSRLSEIEREGNASADELELLANELRKSREQFAGSLAARLTRMWSMIDSLDRIASAEEPSYEASLLKKRIQLERVGLGF